MFDLVTLMNLVTLGVDLEARVAGREATGEEYTAALQKTWDVWLNASVARDMAAAGFIRTEGGWSRPRIRRWWWPF